MNKYLIFIILSISIPLSADYLITYNINSENLEYIYKNNSTSKFTHTSEDGLKEVYVNDDSIYVVHNTPNGKKIIDANSLKVKKRIYNPESYVAKQTEPNYKIRKTSKRKKIAGIEGEVWMVFGRDGGQVYSQHVVVTNNPKVVKVMKNMYLAYSRKDGEILDLQNIFEIEPGYMLIKTDGMLLKSFEELSLAPEKYALPNTNN